MAYQNVSTPRFYVNIAEWLDSLDVIDIDNIYRTLPVNPTQYNSDNITAYNISHLTDKSFIAILGHDGSSYSVDGIGGTDTHFPVVNAGEGGANPLPEFAGFSISTFDGTGFTTIKASGVYTSGSIIIGTYYDMSNAPNLSLTMSREYGGTKEFTTHNGSSMSNTMWSKPPKWGSLGAWELEVGVSQHLAKSGRRGWDLKFSYMDDGDLWGSNQMLNNNLPPGIIYTDIDGDGTYETAYDTDNGTSGDIVTNTSLTYNLLTDDNFFSQVWHKTLGGTLPFIFQPDSSNNKPDQFCIAKFKDNSLKATQSAFNVYDISLSIEEVW